MLLARTAKSERPGLQGRTRNTISLLGIRRIRNQAPDAENPPLRECPSCRMQYLVKEFSLPYSNGAYIEDVAGSPEWQRLFGPCQPRNPYKFKLKKESPGPRPGRTRGERQPGTAPRERPHRHQPFFSTAFHRKNPSSLGWRKIPEPVGDGSGCEVLSWGRAVRSSFSLATRVARLAESGPDAREVA